MLKCRPVVLERVGLHPVCRIETGVLSALSGQRAVVWDDWVFVHSLVGDGGEALIVDRPADLSAVALCGDAGRRADGNGVLMDCCDVSCFSLRGGAFPSGYSKPQLTSRIVYCMFIFFHIQYHYHSYFTHVKV